MPELLQSSDSFAQFIHSGNSMLLSRQTLKIFPRNCDGVVGLSSLEPSVGIDLNLMDPAKAGRTVARSHAKAGLLILVGMNHPFHLRAS